MTDDPNVHVFDFESEGQKIERGEYDFSGGVGTVFLDRWPKDKMTPEIMAFLKKQEAAGKIRFA
ncbi:hypothetical protein [Bifidobacterium oedipodis]|uniref:Uncharacterized protein n=1 Tax=Bifidobacterium oedipodis TaxID=2675322 RepID=A0A7Y0HTN8_9BIFI|nr:hypothetical protein [Bifidobacterium sp. DSM 109957]NMM94773.1 hypothetical protein [Bifidobacterium sp. DSM 109957]